MSVQAFYEFALLLRQCAGKKKFWSKKKARDFAVAMAKRSGENYHSYQCAYPQGGRKHWHVGHSKGTSRW